MERALLKFFGVGVGFGLPFSPACPAYRQAGGRQGHLLLAVETYSLIESPRFRPRFRLPPEEKVEAHAESGAHEKRQCYGSKTFPEIQRDGDQ